jgi:lysophospholipase L1-like esterase
MAVNAGRGAQVRLDGEAQALARGARGAGVADNSKRKADLERAGLYADGYTPDGSTITGLAAEDEVLTPGAVDRKFSAGQKTVAIYGDSISAQNTTPLGYRSIGYMTHANNFLRQALNFPISNNFGVSGETSAQILARISSVLSAGPDIVSLLAGTNDPSSGFTPQQTIDNLKAMYLSLLAAGITVVAIPILPREDGGYSGTAPQIAFKMRYVAQVNRWIELFASRTPGMIFADARKYFMNFSTGYAKTGVTADLLHPNVMGAFYVGKAWAEAVRPFLFPSNFLFTELSDVYHATENPTGNLLTNGFLIGTGGALNSNSGSVAASWSGSRVNGSVLATFSKVARADGLGEWQQITIPATTGAAGEQFRVVQTLNYNSGVYAVGDVLEAAVEVEVEADARITGVVLVINEYDGSGGASRNTYSGDTLSSYFFPAEAWTGVLRTPPHVVQPVVDPATAKIEFNFRFITNSTVAPTNATARFGRPTLRKLVGQQ